MSKLTTVFAILFLDLLAGGAVFMFMWDKVITSMFNVGPISVAQAIGFSIMVGFLTPQSTDKSVGHLSLDEMLVHVVSRNLFYFLLVWGVALWI